MASVIGGLANYALGAGMKLTGNGIIGAASGAQGIASALGGTTLGQGVVQGVGIGLGGMALSGINNVLTGNGPIQRRKKREAAAAAAAASGGCACSGGTSTPKYTCEQKCQYGRYMAEKCAGCKGSSKRKKYSYRVGYSSSGRVTGGMSYGPYSVGYSGYPMSSPASTYRSKPRVAGRQARRTARVAGRQARRTQRQANRQARRAARRN